MVILGDGRLSTHCGHPSGCEADIAAQGQQLLTDRGVCTTNASHFVPNHFS